MFQFQSSICSMFETYQHWCVHFWFHIYEFIQSKIVSIVFSEYYDYHNLRSSILCLIFFVILFVNQHFIPSILCFIIFFYWPEQWLYSASKWINTSVVQNHCQCTSYYWFKNTNFPLVFDTFFWDDYIISVDFGSTVSKVQVN